MTNASINTRRLALIACLDIVKLMWMGWLRVIDDHSNLKYAADL
jgi:hypothetical protein